MAHSTAVRNSVRERKQSGNAILEGAFTILPTFALLFAFLDFGILLFRWTTLQAAVRQRNTTPMVWSVYSSGALGATRRE